MSSGNLAGIAVSTFATAGIIPTPHISVSPPDESDNAIALALVLCPDVNLMSPPTIDTSTLTPFKFPDESY